MIRLNHSLTIQCKINVIKLYSFNDHKLISCLVNVLMSFIDFIAVIL